MSIGYEEKVLIADILNAAAEAMGRAIRAVDQIGKRDVETLRASDRAERAADRIVGDGPDVIRDLKELAGRYVR